MLYRSQADTCNFSVNANDCVPDSYRLVGIVETGLWKRRRRPAFLLPRLQWVMNAAARLIYGLRHSDHISNTFISLHWLRAQGRVRFKVAVLMYKATRGTAPSYLSKLVRVADLRGRRSLRSVRTNRLLVPSVKLSTVGGRAFPVGGPPFGTVCRTMWSD